MGRQAGRKPAACLHWGTMQAHPPPTGVAALGGDVDDQCDLACQVSSVQLLALYVYHCRTSLETAAAWGVILAQVGASRHQSKQPPPSAAAGALRIVEPTREVGSIEAEGIGGRKCNVWPLQRFFWVVTSLGFDRASQQCKTCAAVGAWRAAGKVAGCRRWRVAAAAIPCGAAHVRRRPHDAACRIAASHLEPVAWRLGPLWREPASHNPPRPSNSNCVCVSYNGPTVYDVD